MTDTFFKARGGRLVETDPSSRDEFFATIRRALGRSPGARLGAVPEVTALSRDDSSVAERAQSVLRDAQARADELMSELEESAGRLGWIVTRAESPEDGARYIAALARELRAWAVERSAHPVLEGLPLEAMLEGTGIELRVLAAEDQPDARSQGRQSLRERAIAADLGVTGVDYAIAETGSCALLARKGVSRLVSLLPPVHVAVVERGQVLPSLDELFTLRRDQILKGERRGYMNIISGPSRSGDIEQKLVTGVHGPRAVHMVLLG